MIRINLLSEGRRPVVARTRKRPSLDFGEQDPSLFFLLGGLILGLLVGGLWWYFLSARLKNVEQEVRQANAEYNRLKPIIDEVEAFKQEKEELERKISVIQELQRNQRGPVYIMDQVSQALPDLLWLNQMNLSGSTVSLRGQALNENAIASFIRSLYNVPEFQEPVLRDMPKGRDGTFQFIINFNFSWVVQPTEEEETSETAA